MILRHVLIGAACPIPDDGAPAHLFLLPGEQGPAPAGIIQSVHSPPDLAAALDALRGLFTDHPTIVTIAATKVSGTDREWCTAIEARLGEFLEDLGNCPVDSWAGARNALRNSQRIATGATGRGLLNLYAGKTAICLGAGPSADPEALACIALLAPSCVIFACDSMMHACARAGFAPHFVTMIERAPVMAQYVQGAPESATLIAPPIVDPASVEPFERVCWWQGGCEIYRWLWPDGVPANLGRSAGTLSIAAAILAGCNPIYLVGHDLSYGKGNDSHCPDVHAFAVEAQRIDDAKPLDGIVYSLDRFEVPGWSTFPVLTNGLWNLFRNDIEYMVARASDRQFYCAQHWQGAAIAGVSHGALPDATFRAPITRMELPAEVTREPAERIESLLADMARIEEQCAALAAKILDDRAVVDLNAAAAAMAIHALVPSDNCDFFRYCCRSIYTTLAVRLLLRAGGDDQIAIVQRRCQLLLCETLPALCRRMRADIEKDALCASPA